MAEKNLLYRLVSPDLWIAQSPYWREAPDRIGLIYFPVDTTLATWTTEFEGETRFVVTAGGDARGPWSVPFLGAFDIGDFLVEVSRTGEMP